jgi:anti-sigma regulatory factor (Ser/Thr protein kinase)
VAWASRWGEGCAVSSDHFALDVELVRRDAESCVLTLSGELSSRSAGTVCGAVTKALLEVDRVLVDVSGLRLTWSPAVQVFPSTLAAMGGWPWARLVLFGADARLVASLTELGVVAAVPLAATQLEARQLVERRPPTVARHLDLENAVSSTHRARLFVEAACADWELDALRDNAVIVASELVANAVLHARTECRLMVQLDANGLTIGVQDHRRGWAKRLPSVDATNLRGLGLFVVDRVSRSWGTSPTADGKKVWALLQTPSSGTERRSG